MNSELYIVEWKEGLRTKTDSTPRKEHEAIKFAIQKSVESGGKIVVTIKKKDEKN